MNPRNSRPKVSHERWLVSYADFITLLFAFFVVLYAFSKADQKKQQQVSAAIDNAFDSLSTFPDSVLGPSSKSKMGASNADLAVAGASPVMEDSTLPSARVWDDLDGIRRDLEKTLAPEIGQGIVSVQLSRGGLVISLREAGFFDSGSATPRPDALDTLSKIATALRSSPYDLRVEGHTDNVAIHNPAFDSNWELSSARATRIARLLLELRSISPDRLSAAGYAEFHPVSSNDTAAGRARNRRVDLVLMPRARLKPPVPAATQNGAWRKITDD
jgi:chemotaxis protein MotB